MAKQKTTTLMRFEVEVTEVIHQRKLYVVVAKDADEARKFAESGCTVEETDGKCDGIFNRTSFNVKKLGLTEGTSDRVNYETFADEFKGE